MNQGQGEQTPQAREDSTPDLARQAPRCSVIIAHTRDSITECLDSLARQSIGPDAFEVLVVGSTPETVPRERHPFVIRYLQCQRLNPSRRRNLGVKAARAPIYAFIDDDAEADPDWLNHALGLFEKNPRLAVIGGPTLLPQDAGLRHRLTYKMAHAGFFGNGHENLSEDCDDPRRILGYIICCNMLVHSERIADGNRFEPSIGYGGEDSLFLYDVWQQSDGWILYSTSVSVRHSRGAFGLQFLRSRFHYRRNNGLMLWAKPGLYLGNRKFAAGLVLGTALLVLMIFQPLSIVPIIATHQIISLAYSVRYLKEDWRLTFLFPPALLLHHATYYLGVVTGFLSALHPRYRRKVSKIRSEL